MPMPDPAATMHVASVDYAVTIAELTAAGGKAQFSAPGAIHFIFTFDNGVTEVSPGTWQVSWDMTGFDQAAEEAAIASKLTVICTAISELLGLPLAAVQAAVMIRRLWTLNQNSWSIIPGVSAGPQRIAIPDVMPYP